MYRYIADHSLWLQNKILSIALDRPLLHNKKRKHLVKPKKTCLIVPACVDILCREAYPAASLDDTLTYTE